MKNGGHHGHTYPADKPLPKGTAHLPDALQEILGDVTSTQRGVAKKQHKKKSRAHNKKVVEEGKGDA